MRLRNQAYQGFGSCSGAGGGAAGVPGPEGAPPGAAELFTTSFNSLLGLKYGIFFAGTSTRAPVFGLRPIRGCLWRVRKLPNPRISILSPERRERTILSKIASTITSDSFRVISTTREPSSIRSAFVIAFSSVTKPQYRVHRKNLQAIRGSGLSGSSPLQWLWWRPRPGVGSLPDGFSPRLPSPRGDSARSFSPLRSS